MCMLAGFLTEANSGAHHTESESVCVTRELNKNVHVYNYPDLVLRVTCATERCEPHLCRKFLLASHSQIHQSHFKTTK